MPPKKTTTAAKKTTGSKPAVTTKRAPAARPAAKDTKEKEKATEEGQSILNYYDRKINIVNIWA